MTAEASPAERRKQKMRDQIIEVAERVFAEEGPSGLSMRRLAERIDYSPAAIYKYFSSKHDLVCEIREMFFERLLTRLERVGPPGDWTIASMKRCMACYIETGLEQPNHYRMAFSIEDKVEKEHGEKIPKAMEAAAYLENLIAQGVEAGALRPVDPSVASKSVWSALHGVTVLMADIEDFPHGMPDHSHVTREVLIDFHLELIAYGLKAQ